MKKYIHKKTGVIGELKKDCHVHFKRCPGNVCSLESIHMDFVIGSNDWEEFSEYKVYNFREIAEQLWSLLDNIDTLSDICKPTIDNPNAAMAFYTNALRYASQRFEYFKSDGYKLYTEEEIHELPKQIDFQGFKDK